MITAQQVRDEAAKIAGRIAASATGGDHCATVSEVLFLGEFDRLLARLSDAPDRISEKAPGDPNAEAEALAASIVASAELASDGTGTPSPAEALAREIAASAPQRV